MTDTEILDRIANCSSGEIVFASQLLRDYLGGAGFGMSLEAKARAIVIAALNHPTGDGWLDEIRAMLSELGAGDAPPTPRGTCDACASHGVVGTLVCDTCHGSPARAPSLVGETRAEPDDDAIDLSSPDRLPEQPGGFYPRLMAANETIKSLRSRLSTVEAERDMLAERARLWEDAHAGARSQLEEARAGSEGYRCVLVEIAKGEGRFSRDPITHAGNTIEDMKALAINALTAVPSSETTVTPSPFDEAKWNQRMLDAARITGSTYEQQENAISDAARAYVESLDQNLGES